MEKITATTLKEKIKQFSPNGSYVFYLSEKKGVCTGRIVNNDTDITLSFYLDKSPYVFVQEQGDCVEYPVCAADTQDKLAKEIIKLLNGPMFSREEVSRNLEQLFIQFLDIIDCDSYGYYYPETKRKMKNKITNTTIDNDVFTLRPYYWGDDKDVQNLPNFVYKPDNLEIRWYKYPFRAAVSNKMINENYLKKIIRACITSIQLSEGEKNLSFS